MIGTKLAHYEITSHLGSGGMGDVYQATDSKLGRSVAIKFLPEAFSHDTERVARFQREARVLAALNHSNIAAIHAVEEVDSRHFLVMELVAGETLADRIKRGPIPPVDESLGIAKQICEALEAAHEKGIIHRDLKPANIKITSEGKVKVLDFGLAKAFEAETSKANLSQSPTLSMAATNAGVILGTAAYMSPEQAKGRAVDKRTDIFAFGCVLYEMMTGRAAFEGEDIPEILSRVLQREPDWTLLPANVSPRIRELLRLCLQKDVKKRRSDAADVRIDIEQALVEPAAVSTAARAARGARFAWIALLTAAVVLFAAMAVPAVRHLRATLPLPSPEMRVEITTPATTDLVSLALSPDGRHIVFVAPVDGQPRLWLRPLVSTTAQPLSGTDGASFPFWSPDSRSLGFFAGNSLKRIDIVGGAPQVLANATAGRGGTWNHDGVIVFAPTGSATLLKVSATGGESVAVTRLDAGQTGHKFPQFLPDGRHFIYFGQGGAGQGLYVGALDGTSPNRLASADGAAVVLPSGFLLFPRQNTLFAQTFDFGNLGLYGNPLPIAQQVVVTSTNNVAAMYASAVSATSDIVAYRSGLTGITRQLTWMDRSGKIVGRVGAPDTGALIDVELSPDGKRVAVQRTLNSSSDIWLLDTVRGIPTRFTFDNAQDERPLWSADGKRVLFNSSRTGVMNLFGKLSSGAGADELVLASDQTKTPQDSSPDGRFLLFRSLDPQTKYDLWVLPLSGDKKPFPFLKTPFDERDGQFSPNGKWIVYQSNESGRFEIYVQPFPGPGGKFQISSNGGAQPRWRKDGREIFYVSLDSQMMAAPVKLSADDQSVEAENPVALFPVRIAGGPLPGVGKPQYAVSSDGQQFLINLELDENRSTSITLLLNWKPAAE